MGGTRYTLRVTLGDNTYGHRHSLARALAANVREWLNMDDDDRVRNGPVYVEVLSDNRVKVTGYSVYPVRVADRAVRSWAGTTGYDVTLRPSAAWRNAVTPKPRRNPDDVIASSIVGWNVGAGR